MKNKKRNYYVLTGMFVFAVCLFVCPSLISAALTPNTTYVIVTEKIDTDGTVTSGSTSLNLSTSATSDASGKISFTLSGVPDNSEANFLVIYIKDGNGNTVRKSIAPCPDPSATMPLGVSGMTDLQTDAILAGAVAAGSDDPILAVFLFTIVRSTGMTASEAAAMATIGKTAVTQDNTGFIGYMTANGVTASQLSIYRNKIVSLLAAADSGYTKLIKDSVDAASDAAELSKRGEAAAKLLNVLVQAATTAGFQQDLVLEAFNSMGSVAEPLMQAAIVDSSLSAATGQMVNSTMSGGIMKLRAEKEIEKYTQALSDLGATGDDLTTFNSAATTLVNTMTGTFQTFETVFTGDETDAEIQAAQNILDTAMGNAFDQFMSSAASSDARITTMITNINNALGIDTGLDGSEFKFRKSDGTQTNWPVMMVILNDWISARVSAGGGLTYTRDTVAIPALMTWLANRINYVGSFPAQAVSYARMFAIQEDIMIREFTRFSSQQSAGTEMDLHAALEKALARGLLTIAGNIGGTMDGTTALSTTQSQAIVTLLKSPQF